MVCGSIIYDWGGTVVLSQSECAPEVRTSGIDFCSPRGIEQVVENHHGRGENGGGGVVVF